jgi:hypothetical protein
MLSDCETCETCETFETNEINEFFTRIKLRKIRQTRPYRVFLTRTNGLFKIQFTLNMDSSIYCNNEDFLYDNTSFDKKSRFNVDDIVNISDVDNVS